jgi:hypothetical protein
MKQVVPVHELELESGFDQTGIPSRDGVNGSEFSNL